MIEPKKYYRMYVKYLRAIDKVLSVTSYWEEYVSTIDEKSSLPVDNKLDTTEGVKMDLD